jgi:hypothetical protein
MMIAIGLVALLMSTIQHRRSLQLLRTEYGDTTPISTAGVVGGLFAVFGVTAPIAVLLHL